MVLWLHVDDANKESQALLMNSKALDSSPPILMAPGTQSNKSYREWKALYARLFTL